MKTNKLFLLSVMLFLSVALHAQSLDVEEKPAIDIQKMEWLCGYWIGDGFGGVSEEIWTPAVDDTMMGMFRHSKDGKVTFYEFMHLTPEAMKLKHFDPNLTAWEEKADYVTFPLVEVTKDRIIFTGLEIWKKSENEIEMTLQLEENGKLEKEVFHFKKSSL